MNYWYIVAQVFGAITIGFELFTYQIKDKTKFFLVSGIGSVFWLCMFIAIGLATGMSTQLSLILAAVYSILRNFIFFWMFKQNTPEAKERGLRIILVMVSLAIVAGIFTVLSAPPQIRWLHISGIVAAVLFAIGQYMPGVHYVRLSVLLVAVFVGLTQTPLNILYGDLRWNIMGILIELAKVSSVLVFYIRYAAQPKTSQIKFSKP
jgi:hypothetical protein